MAPPNRHPGRCGPWTLRHFPGLLIRSHRGWVFKLRCAHGSHCAPQMDSPPHRQPIRGGGQSFPGVQVGTGSWRGSPGVKLESSGKEARCTHGGSDPLPAFKGPGWVGSCSPSLSTDILTPGGAQRSFHPALQPAPWRRTGRVS